MWWALSSKIGVCSTQLDKGATLAELEIFHHPASERNLIGMKKFHGEAGRNKRFPIIRPILLRLLAQLDQTSLEGATLHAVYFLAFAAFLQVGEFA